ncbi:MAG: ribonuclease H-like domain-containing protein [Pontimonas sp.]|nr:ribonuclease H-like domain-containing protein [Pontimonas sp.]
MQRLGDGSWVISASDLAVFASCPWRLARVADEKLGKGVSVPDITDPMMDLVARLGLEHEARQLELLKSKMQVIELSYKPADPSDASTWRTTIEQARDETLRALSSDAGALFQATLFEDALPGSPVPIGFQGFADFIVKSGEVWEVWDSKLARRAKDHALIQLAAYHDQLERAGVPLANTVQIILGDGTHSIHEVADLLTPYRQMREQVIALIAHRVADPLPLPWGDESFAPCGTKGCPACSEQIVAMDDLFQIAGLRKTQREKILTGGFVTLREFAEASREEVRRAVPGIGRDALEGLHLQASLQVASRNNPDGRPAWEVLSRGMIENLPAPNPGDIFFDFEGDPTYQEFASDGSPLGSLSHGDDSVWFGIEYLFGMWGEDLNPGSADTSFLPLWAETFEQEREALETFLSLLEQRTAAFPGLHVYHYAPYERTRLGQMAKRHQIDSPMLRSLLDHHLVDLYPVVMKGVKVGLPSYGLKALESLYFDPDTRTGIAGGGESVVAFSDYLLALTQNNQQAASELKDSILHYNRIDCFSTQALRDWLITTALRR